MPTTLLKATVGAGKTQAAIQRLLDTALSPTSDPFPRIWVLLATRRQETVFRQRLVETLSPQQAALFNVEFFNFYDLNARLLAIGKQPVRRLDEPTRLALLRLVIRQLVAENRLSLFSSIALTHGFIRNVATFIYELKQNRIDDRDFTRAARQARDMDLASIYSAYQHVLIREQLVDREGEAWLAVLALEKPLPVVQGISLLIVDGYDQFNPVQADLLARLSAQVQNTLITLTDAGIGVIGARFNEAQEALASAFAEAGQSLEIESVSAFRDTRPDDLRALTQGIIENKGIAAPLENILWIEAPDPYQEVAAVLRTLKRRLLSGASAESCLIAVRDWGRYGRAFLTLQHAYDVPLAINFHLTLQENPAIGVLLRVLSLTSSRRPFARREVLDILRSPYLQPRFTEQELDLLTLISLRGVVIEGVNQWNQALQNASREIVGEDDEREPLCSADDANHLAEKLNQFFEDVTPPQKASLGAFVAWIEQLIGEDVTEEGDPNADFSLNMGRAIREAATDDATKARDLTALLSLKYILRGFLKVEGLARQFQTDDDIELSWGDFYAELMGVLASASDSLPLRGRDGCVLVTSATDARGLSHDHVAVVGLAESIFPAPTPNDPFYLDDERDQLSKLGIPLKSGAARVSEEGIFFELLSLAQKSLILSRPTIENAKPWEASYFWHRSRAALSIHDKRDTRGIQRISVSKSVEYADVANEQEALIALATLAKEGQSAPQLEAWMWEQPHMAQVWQHVHHAAQVEQGRMSEGAFNEYSGRLGDVDLREAIRAQIQSGKFSATQLNNIAKCGYYWFAERLLHLEELEEPILGFDALIQGNINHEILEKTYIQIRDKGFVIAPAHTEQALDVLRGVATEVLRKAPFKYNFRPTSVWQQEQRTIQQQLATVVEADFEGHHDKLPHGRRPLLLEYAFGDNRVPLPVHDSRAQLRGKIDRVDVIDGEVPQYIIIDYKTGRSSIDKTGLEKGTNFQLLTYLTALEQQYIPQHGGRIVMGLFWALRQNDIGGELDLNAVSRSNDHDRVQANLAHLTAHYERISEGDFGVWYKDREDSKLCASYCPYSQLCRSAITRNIRSEVSE
jgi:ATP-dependent helicase/DNAse subunit B